MKCPRLTVRLLPEQLQVLEEMRDKMGVSCSLLVRSIIFDFIQRNEDCLERIIEGTTELQKRNADN